jgi:hypothetical protein
MRGKEEDRAMTKPATVRRGPTPEEIVAEQNRVAKAAKELREAAEMQTPEPPREFHAVPAVRPAGTEVAADSRTAAQAYVDDVAPATMAGQGIRYNSKDGKYTVSATGEVLGPDTDYIAIADETQAGFIRFRGEGIQPEKILGLIYDGFRLPSRESLGDNDPSQWSTGLSGRPEDPWQSQVNLVLQNVQTGELFTFSTTSQTGRRAVGNLLRHYNRMLRATPDDYPVVRLKSGGFNHKDTRVGWVHCPVFAVVGRTPRNAAATPDTSPAGDMDDQIPF